MDQVISDNLRYFLNNCILPIKYHDVNINFMNYLPSIKNGTNISKTIIKYILEVYIKLNSLGTGFNALSCNPLLKIFLHKKFMVDNNDMYIEIIVNNEVYGSTKIKDSKSNKLSKQTKLLYELRDVLNIMITQYNTKYIHNKSEYPLINYSNLLHITKISITYNKNILMKKLAKNDIFCLLYNIMTNDYDSISITLNTMNIHPFIGYSAMSKNANMNMLINKLCINKICLDNYVLNNNIVITDIINYIKCYINLLTQPYLNYIEDY